MEPNGRLLGGRYELTGLIATGGMGQVWQGRDKVLARDVAVKVLRSEFTGDPTFLARFRSEAQLAAGLVHPNIATLFDYGEVPAADPRSEHLAYLVMELVRGESLSTVLHRDRRLTPERTLDVLRQSAAGLAAAHAAGVVHRDVKPGNLLLADDGTVKVTDFGVAVTAASQQLTQVGQVIGTASYLSPEQAEGARATPASDVYALGLVGYECLSGQRAFDGESSVQVLMAQIHDAPPPLPGDVPAPVRQLLDTAMAKDPARRFHDGAAFRDAVDAVRQGRAASDGPRTAVLPAYREGAADRTVSVAAVAGAGARPPASTRAMPPVRAGTAPVAPEPHRRRRLLVPLLALLAVAAIVLGGVALANRSDEAATGTAPTTTSAAPSASPTASSARPSPSTTSATPTSTQPAPVDADDYVGRPVDDVERELIGLGYAVVREPRVNGAEAEGTVVDLQPTGRLDPGATVTVVFATAPPPPTPSATPTASPTAGNEDEPDENEPDENENGGGSGKGKDDKPGRGNNG
ncbi:serine/threonine protein kinase [Modestobacter muralis]|uniref:non-specific serine/threonine protein kinase n=1 Tax=Modestobacter muralis TaxID=1608614 RepID=A0A6P0EMC4_9ACTN|nr:Stk1 family PASTA domain-containing Ser/Thr kinase [Modestobacter muralis]NEK92672.1 serine/threonine protein kinase [Modestobacter muralis]NEN49439.1 serine/threonine protein kinase [Modestobacter muralis]